MMHLPLSRSVSRFAALGLLGVALVLLHAALVRPLDQVSPGPSP